VKTFYFEKEDATPLSGPYREQWKLLSPDDEYIWQEEDTVRTIKLGSGWYAEHLELRLSYIANKFEEAIEGLLEKVQTRTKGYPLGVGINQCIEDRGAGYLERATQFLIDIRNGKKPDRAVWRYRGPGKFKTLAGDIFVTVDDKEIRIRHQDSISLEAITDDDTVEANRENDTWILNILKEDRSLVTMVFEFQPIEVDVDYGWPRVKGSPLFTTLFKLEERSVIEEMESGQIIDLNKLRVHLKGDPNKEDLRFPHMISELRAAETPSDRPRSEPYVVIPGEGLDVILYEATPSSIRAVIRTEPEMKDRLRNAQVLLVEKTTEGGWRIGVVFRREEEAQGLNWILEGSPERPERSNYEIVVISPEDDA